MMPQRPSIAFAKCRTRRDSLQQRGGRRQSTWDKPCRLLPLFCCSQRTLLPRGTNRCFRTVHRLAVSRQTRTSCNYGRRPAAYQQKRLLAFGEGLASRGEVAATRAGRRCPPRAGRRRASAFLSCRARVSARRRQLEAINSWRLPSRIMIMPRVPALPHRTSPCGPAPTRPDCPCTRQPPQRNQRLAIRSSSR
jgi:hypothetical protein